PFAHRHVQVVGFCPAIALLLRPQQPLPSLASPIALVNTRKRQAPSPCRFGQCHPLTVQFDVNRVAAPSLSVSIAQLLTDLLARHCLGASHLSRLPIRPSVRITSSTASKVSATYTRNPNARRFS